MSDVPVPQRYRVEELLGRGGMAAVYRVYDTETGRSVALKRFRDRERGGEATNDGADARIALFRREYQTLVQLAHPGAIEVFDYGVDEHGPYYTMELLDGADLGALAPMAWRQACRVARDVASCLAILHSRRLLHRDVSPGNIRCGDDGRAKLIDFGAMGAMEASRDIVGTPPCVPPEAFYRQPLDPRSDLYSLGAVLYFALTRKHAYPARNLRDLPRAWERPPAMPSEQAEEIPAELDHLVLSLLSLDASSRPVSAAEVIDRLEAVAEIPSTRAVGVAQAYLATPNLVGREPALQRFRSLLGRADRQHGSVVMVEAAPGLGRSRLLDAFGLEAKLAGATVLEAGMTEAAAGPFGMARGWADALLPALGRAALRAAEEHAGTLGHLSSTLHERMGHPELAVFGSETERTARLQAGLLGWLRTVARDHFLAVFADDLHRADPESAGLFVDLAEGIGASRMIVVASAEEGAASAVGDAVRLLRETATCLPLAPLRAEETGELLGSIFGESSRLEALVDWMHRQSAGNPRLCMELTAYLVDRGHVRHEAGVWILPENPDALDVPTAFETMLAARLANLSRDARVLAEARALTTAGETLEAGEYASLLGGEDAVARSRAAVSELCESGVFAPAGGGHVFTQPSFVQVLDGELSEADRCERHRALARVYGERSVVPMVTAHHLQQGGESGTVLDWLLERLTLDAEFLGHRASAALARAIEAALGEAKRQRRPPHQQMRLLMGLLDCASQVDAELTRYADELMEHLRRDTGLDLWEALDPGMDPRERTSTALAKARERHEKTPPERRGLPPDEAVARLGLALRRIQAAQARVRDVKGCMAVPALLEPFAALSPYAAFAYDVLYYGVRRMLGREGTEEYRKTVDRAAEGFDGVDAEAVWVTRMIVAYYTSMCAYYESLSDWVLARADELAQSPMFEAMAWQVRLQFHLARGNAAEIAVCRRQRDLAQARRPTTSQHATTGARMELVMAGRFHDLMQLKSLLEPLDAQALAYAGWEPIAEQAHGEYHYARGEWNAARAHLESALVASAPGELAWWSDIMARCIETMLHQGEAEAACRRGAVALEEAERNEVDWLERLSLRLAVGLAEVAADRHEEGFARIDAVRRDVEERGVLDIYAGSAETLARAALLAGDEERFRDALARVAALYRPGQYPPLVAKYERLLEEGRRRFGDDGASSPGQREAMARAASRVASCLDPATTRAERVARALALLLEESGGRGATLFGLWDGELRWLGSHDGHAPSEEIEEAVRDYFEAQLDTAAETVASLPPGSEAEPIRWRIGDRTCRPHLLVCPWKDEEECLAGIAVVEAEGDAELLAPLLAALAAHLARAGDTSPVPLLDL